jgi:hypothetical protein
MSGNMLYAPYIASLNARVTHLHHNLGQIILPSGIQEAISPAVKNSA